MGQTGDFIFFSQKRWKTIEILIGILVFISGLFSFAVFKGFTDSPFEQKFSDDNLELIINQISTRTPGKMAIQGEGPILEIENNDDVYFLRRNGISQEKTVFLTFDDGPDSVYTRQILDIFEKENIKATFFATGENLYQHSDVAKELVDRGHLIGIHTFSHTPESENLKNKNMQMYFEFELTQRLIEDATGFTSKLFRLPFWGIEDTLSMNNLVLAANAKQRGYEIAGSTLDTLDWQAKNPEEIVKTVKSQEVKNPIILLHDGGADRKNTIEALPGIITHYRSLGYQFGRVDELFPGQEVFVPANFLEKLYAKSAILVYTFWRNLPHYASAVFVLGLVIFGAHSFIIALFAIAHKVREKRLKEFGKKFKLEVSVVIPAYNEARVITKTVKSVWAQDYKNLEVIVVNDGSTDSTEKKLDRLLFDNPTKRIKVIWQENQGKFAALNSGFAESKGKIVVAIDADTQIGYTTVSQFVRHFEDKKVGAVAGNVKVGNQINFLTLLQELDYRMAINLERRAFDFLNSIYLVPGAVGAWRKKAVEKVGGFSSATLTEDAELGLRLKKAGYKVVYEPEAVGFTEAPINLPSLFRQRFRWTFGTLQTFWLHKDMNFRPKYGILGMIILPYAILIQIPSMILAPFVELAALWVAIFVSLKYVIFVLLGLLAVRYLLFGLASKLANEDLSLWVFVLPYRFLYQFLWYFVLDVAIFTALRGSFVSWKKMPHFGLVKLEKLELPKPIIAPDMISVSK